MTKLLTKRKEKWKNQFKPNVLRGSALNPNISDAIRYKKRLDNLIKKMTDETNIEIKKLFKSDHSKEYFAQDATLSSQARILTNALIQKFTDMFASVAKPIAEKVVNEADKSSTTALHMSLKDLSGGLSIKVSSISEDTKQILNASISENVALIKSIPQQYLNGVQQAVMRSITSDGGLSTLIPYLHEKMTYKRARMIAYDQTRKAFNSINRGKMERLGLKEFEWLHSGGSSHPRKLHQQLSGQIFSLDNPPVIGVMYGEEVRGYPGDLPNCRCRYRVIVKFGD